MPLKIFFRDSSPFGKSFLPLAAVYNSSGGKNRGVFIELKLVACFEIEAGSER